ncbi:MAG: PadR family transcriptional regulator, partial [Actinomycetota bacterium]|nr:PadR family transcriptional regulator [Actinomycetota bacterium]
MKRSNSRFAVLGYLGLGPASPYELVRLMKSGTIHRVWPRAESKVYEEPKRLVDDGLARARNDGDRRTVYEITDAGQQWLAEQLDEPEGTLTLEFEAALKVLFADHGTR